MRLWLCVHLPRLALEAIRPCWSEAGCYVVLQQGRVLVASEEALSFGVRGGMRAGGVAALAPDTVLLDRNPDLERDALNTVAMALLQFTPEVSAAEEFCILLDVSASLRLFGGVRALCRRVADSVKRLGFTLGLGAAPTATGAWLLARTERVRNQSLCRRVMTMKSLNRLLDRLPCSMLPATLPYAEWLSGIGASWIADLRKLPRPGLLRRTDRSLLEQLDRAYGLAPELFEWIRVAESFSARMETFDRIEQTDALMSGATRLILQLVGWLVAMHKAVSVFVLILEHERGRTARAPTEIEIGLAEPAWHEAHLIRLLQERLGHIELIAPVIAMRLETRNLTAMLVPSESLFPDPGGSPADWNRLLELLTARVGKNNVLTPGCIDDYRPEICNTWVPVVDLVARTGRHRQEVRSIERPFWILAQPIALLTRDERPFYGSRLKLVRGPERVEAGWWDNQGTARDYFVAQDDSASCYWIYLERSREPRWFLHGLYA